MPSLDCIITLNIRVRHPINIIPRRQHAQTGSMFIIWREKPGTALSFMAGNSQAALSIIYVTAIRVKPLGCMKSSDIG